MIRPYSFDGKVARIAVRVTPRASRQEAAGVVEAGEGRTALAVRLRAPPAEGAANRALLVFLAQALGVPKSSLSIASGASARLKIVRIEGADPERLARLCAQ